MGAMPTPLPPWTLALALLLPVSHASGAPVAGGPPGGPPGGLPAPGAPQDSSSTAPEEAPVLTGELADDVSTTHHSVEIAGVQVDYRADAGTMVMRSEEGEARATIYYTAYFREGAEPVAERPITYCFNGGPGSSSVWLHLGVYGPRRVKMTDDGFAPPPPYELVDNAHSLLDVTDLVFIDPVGTGYSRAVEGEDPHQFHGLEEDIESVGEFIRLFTTRHQRWASPKFLSGESYGTTRAAGLALHLQSRHGLYLNGIVMVSAILNFQTARFDRGNDLPYALFLPTYTATAWYHGRLAPELQGDLGATLREVEEFASTDYTLALMEGDRLDPGRRQEIAERLARYTGLSVEYVLATDLRIRIHRFCKELLRSEDRTVGRLDSRFTGTDVDAAGEGYEFDPSYAAIQGPYTACLNQYLRGELGFESDLPYEILTGRVHPWSYASSENRYVNVGERLRQAMTRNPSLRVYVANGLYDLATPYYATRYTFDHLGLDPELAGNVTMGDYPAGHMMYIHLPSLERFRDEVVAFLRSAR